jgi:hypothetical protein
VVGFGERPLLHDLLVALKVGGLFAILHGSQN